jgi:serine/threonine protein kinase
LGYTVASTITAANITPYHALELLSKEASRASDIYSLGVLIYELFLGEVPVTSSLELNKLGGKLPEDRLPTSKNPALPKWLDELCNKTILCDEFERFDNLAEMDSFIKDNLKDQSTTADKGKEKEKIQEDSLEYKIRSGSIQFIKSLGKVAFQGYFRLSMT